MAVNVFKGPAQEKPSINGKGSQEILPLTGELLVTVAYSGRESQFSQESGQWKTNNAPVDDLTSVFIEPALNELSGGRKERLWRGFRVD